MRLSVVFVILCFCLLSVLADDDDDHHDDGGGVVIETKNGRIAGEKLKTLIDGTTYYSFKGIPYAKPPIGHYRFRPPEPVENWDGTKDTKKHKNICLQLNKVVEGDDDDDDDDDDDKDDKNSKEDDDYRDAKPFSLGDEDCLYLNVYSPDISEDTKLPVIVYIHGGGFFEGKGNAEEYGPDFLMEKNVVLVTMNYRLGPFGFLAIEGSHISGNMGLKDQQLALQWVYDNINRFGGNKDLITIFGNSAGAGSAHHHVVNPVSSKLIKRAIMSSGSLLNTWAVSDLEQEEHIMRQMGYLMPSVTDRDTLLEFLHEADQATILASLPTHHGPDAVDMVFLPRTEDDDDFRPFLTKEPAEILSQKSFSDIDTMFGFASHESYLFVKSDVEDSIFMQDLDRSFRVPFPTRDFDGLTKKKKVEALKEVRNHYFGDSKISTATDSQYIDLTSDIYFGYGIHQSVKYHAKNSDGKTYHYRFAVDAGLNMYKIKANITKAIATHADDLCYVFRCEAFDKVYRRMTPDSVERQSIDRFTGSIVNFAKYGEPMPEKRTEWPPVEEDTEYFVNIKNDGIFVSANPHRKDFPFWTELLEKYKNKNSKRDEL